MEADQAADGRVPRGVRRRLHTQCKPLLGAVGRGAHRPDARRPTQPVRVSVSEGKARLATDHRAGSAHAGAHAESLRDVGPHRRRLCLAPLAAGADAGAVVWLRHMRHADGDGDETRLEVLIRHPEGAIVGGGLLDFLGVHVIVERRPHARLLHLDRIVREATPPLKAPPRVAQLEQPRPGVVALGELLGLDECVRMAGHEARCLCGRPRLALRDDVLPRRRAADEELVVVVPAV